MSGFKVNTFDSNKKNDNYYDLIINNGFSWYKLNKDKKKFLEDNGAKNGEYIEIKNNIIYNNKRKILNLLALKKIIVHKETIKKTYNHSLLKEQLYYRKKHKVAPLLSKYKIRNLLTSYANLDYINKAKILKDYNFLASKNPKLKRDGYSVYIDKKLQKLFIIETKGGKRNILGYAKVSTGIFRGDKYNKKNYKYPTRETPNIIVEPLKGYGMHPGDKRERTPYGKQGTKVVPIGNYNIRKGEYYLVGNRFDTSLLIHGTSQVSQSKLGEKASHGCVRTKDIMIDILNNLNNHNLLNYVVIWDGNKNNLPKDVNK